MKVLLAVNSLPPEKGRDVCGSLLLCDAGEVVVKEEEEVKVCGALRLRRAEEDERKREWRR